MLDLSSFAKALTSLLEAYQRYSACQDDLLIRDGCIQRFEYCYELSHKMLRRQLASDSATPEEVKDASFQTLIRLGIQAKYIDSSLDNWLLYRKLRATTSHTYSETPALEVIKYLPQFIDELNFLYTQLETRNER